MFNLHYSEFDAYSNWLLQEEGWVVCRAFKKPTPNPRPCYNTYSPFYIRDHDQYVLEQLPDVTRPMRIMESNPGGNFHEQPLGFGGENEPKLTCGIFEIPRLDSPSMTTNLATSECFDASSMTNKRDQNTQRDESRGQFIDWKVLDKLLSSQLSESVSGSNSNLPMVPLEYDINDPNQGDQFLASFRS